MSMIPAALPEACGASEGMPGSKATGSFHLGLVTTLVLLWSAMYTSGGFFCMSPEPPSLMASSISAEVMEAALFLVSP